MEKYSDSAFRTAVARREPVPKTVPETVPETADRGPTGPLSMRDRLAVVARRCAVLPPRDVGEKALIALWRRAGNVRAYRLWTLDLRTLDSAGPRPGGANAAAWLPPGCSARFLEPGECLALAADPALGLRAPFVYTALARGDECFAVFDGGEPASFAWYARRPTALPDGLTIYFDDGFVCLHHSHTRPDWRGRGLFGAGLRAALCHYDARGFVAAVEVSDDASLRALRRAGGEIFGTAYVVRRAGRPAILHTPGCRRLAARLRPTP